MECSVKGLCLICNETTAVLNESNVRRQWKKKNIEECVPADELATMKRWHHNRILAQGRKQLSGGCMQHNLVLERLHTS